MKYFLISVILRTGCYLQLQQGSSCEQALQFSAKKLSFLELPLIFNELKAKTTVFRQCWVKNL